MQTTPAERIDDFTERGWWGRATVLDLFDAACARAPEHVALVDPPNRADFTEGEPLRLRYDEVAAHVESLSRQFFAGGIRHDDIVLVQIPNIVELPLVYLALARLGAVLSPLPMQYGRVEITKARDMVTPKAYVGTSSFKGQDIVAQAAEVLGDSCACFDIASATSPGARPVVLSQPVRAGNDDWDRYVEGLEISANDVLTICWTSGTTGQPKGVPRSHNLWIASATAAHDCAGMKDFEAILNPFPMVNMAGISGFMFPWLMRSATLVLHQPLDLPVFLQQLQQEKIAYSIAPPAVLNMLLNKRELLDAIDLSHLRAIGSGSAPLSAHMVAGFQDDYGIAVLNIFGSNEGMCLASDARDLPDPADRASFFPRFGVPAYDWSNRASATIRTRIVDTETREEIDRPGTPGELEIWGATVFDGYWQAPETNAEVFSADGYFRTGDLFEIAGDGEQARFYRFVGRCKDIINRGGMKISPDEIDNLLAGHPGVAEAAVVGYDDDVLGERVGVVVVPKPGKTVALEDIIAFLQDAGLAKFKLPEDLRTTTALPRNAIGKVLRRDLRDLF